MLYFLFVVVDLQPETVTQFLFDNPDFLDSFVQQHVHEDKIRQWSLRKHKVQGHNVVALTNGENFNNLNHYGDHRFTKLKTRPMNSVYEKIITQQSGLRQ